MVKPPLATTYVSTWAGEQRRLTILPFQLQGVHIQAPSPTDEKIKGCSCEGQRGHGGGGEAMKTRAITKMDLETTKEEKQNPEGEDEGGKGETTLGWKGRIRRCYDVHFICWVF